MGELEESSIRRHLMGEDMRKMRSALFIKPGLKAGVETAKEAWRSHGQLAANGVWEGRVRRVFHGTLQGVGP